MVRGNSSNLGIASEMPAAQDAGTLRRKAIRKQNLMIELLLPHHGLDLSMTRSRGK